MGKCLRETNEARLLREAEQPPFTGGAKQRFQA